MSDEPGAAPGGRSANGAVRDSADALLLALLLVCIVAVDRCRVADSALEYLEANGRPGAAGDAVDERFDTARVAVGVAGVLLAAVATHRLARRMSDEGAAKRIRVLGTLAIAGWILWQLTGKPLAELAAAGLAIAALASTASHTIGDVREAGRRASAVTIQVVIVFALFAVVILVPYTSAQLIDVLRAWGDGGFLSERAARPVAGIAAALLLGAVIRGSAVRLLTPDVGGRTFGRAQPLADRASRVLRAGGVALALYAAALGAAAALWVLGVKVAALVLAGGALIAFVTTPGPPLVPAGDSPEQLRSMRQLASTLGVAPLAVVLGGLVTALVDSLLLPEPTGPAAADWRLGLYVTLVVVLFAFVGGATYRSAQRPTSELREAARVPGWPLGAAAFVTAFAPGAVFDLPPEADLVGALLLLALAVLLALRAFGEHGAPELWAGWGAAMGMAAGVYVDPVGAPRAHGTFAVVMVGFTALLVALHVLAATLARRDTHWRALPRIPAALALGAWVGLALAFFDDGRHQVRTVPREASPVTLDRAVALWLRREWTEAERRPAFLPMLLVAASGGGAKAAYWTDLVLDCAFGEGSPDPDAGDECPPDRRGRGPQRSRRLFLTSSVSGGSVGVFHLLSRLRDAEGADEWVDDTAREVLSPAMAWGVFHDLPVFMLGIPTDPGECDGGLACRVHADRALVQEAAVAGFRGDPIVPPAGHGLLSLDPDGPLPVFNGAQDGASGRVVMSPAALAPDRHPSPACPTPKSTYPAIGAIDGHDALRRGEDLAQVSAAMLSARFPGVAPAGRLGRAGTQRQRRSCAAPRVLPAVTVRDGGYIENSGLLTIVDLLPRIQAVIARWKRADPAARGGVVVRPVVLSIDDDPAILEAAPTEAVTRRDRLGISKRAGTAYLTTIARERLAACAVPGVTYLRLSPPPRVGARAASGWELSETVRRHDLGDALGQGEAAARRLDHLRRILDGEARPGCLG